MTALNRDASLAARGAGPDLRHRRHRLRPARPPLQALPGQRGLRRRRRRRRALPRRRRARRSPTGSSPAAAAATWTGCARTSRPSVSDDELLLLADAQTSGGLLVAGELPGHPVIGELVPQGESRRHRAVSPWTAVGGEVRGALAPSLETPAGGSRAVVGCGPWQLRGRAVRGACGCPPSRLAADRHQDRLRIFLRLSSHLFEDMPQVRGLSLSVPSG